MIIQEKINANAHDCIRQKSTAGKQRSLRPAAFSSKSRQNTALDAMERYPQTKSWANKSVNRRWLAVGFSNSFPSLSMFGLSTFTSLVCQPGFLRRYALMDEFIDYLEAAVRDAIRTVVGWTAVIVATTVLGLWIGMSISDGEFATLSDLQLAILLLPFAWLVSLKFAFAIAVTAVALYLPLKIDSRRLMIAAGSVNFATWILISISIDWL
jgi:hypothetical protein